MNKPKVSIIIPTHNRKEYLKLVLRSIATLNYPKDQYEIIVVDDGSEDGTDRLIQELKSELQVALHYYRQANRGISAARNIGISNSNGSTLVFTDDDCIVEPNWLQKLLKQLNSAKVGAVGGPDSAPITSSFLAKCIDYSVTSFIGTGGVRQGKFMRLARYYPRGFNMAVPKAIIEEVGNFDETLVAGEDIELAYRIKRAGYSLRYAADALVWHRRRDSISNFFKQISLRGYTRVELARRHKGLIEFPYLMPVLIVIGFIVLLSLSFVIPLILKILYYTVCFYIFIIFVTGIKGAINIKDMRALLLIPILLTIQHVAYGLGFLIALLSRKIYVKKDSNY